jgi:hypothetical protein
MSNPSFGAEATGVITMDTTPAVDDTGPVAGVAALLAIYKTTGAAATAFVLACGVHASTKEITMSNTTIATTDTVQISSLVVTVPTGTPS